MSPRAGVVCISGAAVNPETGERTQSLATCKHVAPYESNVDLVLEFAGSTFDQVCKGVSCELKFKTEPDAPVPAQTNAEAVARGS